MHMKYSVFWNLNDVTYKYFYSTNVFFGKKRLELGSIILHCPLTAMKFILTSDIIMRNYVALLGFTDLACATYEEIAVTFCNIVSYVLLLAILIHRRMPRYCIKLASIIFLVMIVIRCLTLFE